MMSQTTSAVQPGDVDSERSPMIVADTKGLGSLITLEVDNRPYKVSLVAKGFLRRLWGQTYSVVEPSSGITTLVRYRVLANRIEVQRNGEARASMRLRTVGPSRLVVGKDEYDVAFGKLRGVIEIAKDGETVASGSIRTTSVRFQEAAGPIKTILPELAVGLCIWLKNFQGFLGTMLGGQA